MVVQPARPTRLVAHGQQRQGQQQHGPAVAQAVPLPTHKRRHAAAVAADMPVQHPMPAVADMPKVAVAVIRESNYLN
jgi:hypothetical protein